jgi:hypothetical protein
MKCSLPDLTKHNLDAIGDSLRASRAVLDQVAKEVKIPKDLSFMSMEGRQSRIVEAHSKTFDRVFHTRYFPLYDPRSRIMLEHWLSTKNGLFWVSVKPGLGKSTFMKWLVQSLMTMEILRQWAGIADLVTASFYSWVSGTSIQKSQHGLLRSLLCEILSKCPQLIPTIFPYRWGSRSALVAPFKIPELKAAILRLATSVPNTKFASSSTVSMNMMTTTSTSSKTLLN